MKKRGTIAVLCALSLALVACGGKPAPASSGTDEAATTEATSTEATNSTTSSTTTEAATPAPTTPVGTWKVAAAESQGVKMVGDFATIATMFGGGDEAAADGYNMTIELKDDGTGTISMGSDSHGITWSESGGTISMTADGESSTVMTGTLEDGALKLSLDDESGMTIIMTQDGTYAGGKTYDISKAKPITSEKALVGTWKLVGISMMGVSMSGDAESMAALFDYDVPSATFSAGGTANMFGDESTYSVSAEGATIVDSDISMDLLMLDDNLVIDMSGAVGGMEAYMVLGK